MDSIEPFARHIPYQVGVGNHGEREGGSKGSGGPLVEHAAGRRRTDGGGSAGAAARPPPHLAGRAGQAWQQGCGPRPSNCLFLHTRCPRLQSMIMSGAAPTAGSRTPRASWTRTSRPGATLVGGRVLRAGLGGLGAGRRRAAWRAAAVLGWRHGLDVQLAWLPAVLRGPSPCTAALAQATTRAASAACRSAGASRCPMLQTLPTGPAI